MEYKITKDIISFLQSKLTERGAKATLCRQAGIRQSALSKIINGQAKSVYQEIWQRLCTVFPELSSMAQVEGVPYINHSVLARNISNSTVNNNVSSDLETFRRKVLDAIMQSDLTPDAKEKVYNLVREVK